MSQIIQWCPIQWALCTLFLFSTVTASAEIRREDIGELRIHDLLLRPSFNLREPGQGNFTIGESSFAVRWELEEHYAGVIRIGSRSLLNPLIHYSDTVNDDVMLIEAFAEYQNPYGRFRFGRLPVEFGLEGRLWERYLIFPRSLLFQHRAVMLRDLGVSYRIEHRSWYTGFVISNGESDSDKDGRAWYTGSWGYVGDQFEVGMTGQTGSTKPLSTSTSNDTLAGVDPLNEAKWRIGGIYATVEKRDWGFSLEAYLGEMEQEQVVTRYATGHTDLRVNMGKFWGTHLRYDFFDPRLRKDGNLEQQVSLAFVLSNATKSSNLILVGTKTIEEGHTQVPNDELRLIWSLSPGAVVRF